jgi:hypothetical protein
MSKPLFSVENLVGEAPVPLTVKLNPEWDKAISHRNSLQFRLAPGTNASLFLHEHLQSSDPKQVSDLLESDAIIGYVLNCEGQNWTIKTESTSNGEFGVIVYTAAGKPYLFGEANVDSEGNWSANFATLYPGIRNSKKCRLVGGIKGRTGQRTEAQIGGSCSF